MDTLSPQEAMSRMGTNNYGHGFAPHTPEELALLDKEQAEDITVEDVAPVEDTTVGEQVGNERKRRWWERS